MKNNELRIGNLVKDRGNKTLRVDWIEQDKACQEMIIDEGFNVHPMTEYFEYLKPIPLTEEWLVKFGFERTYYGRELNGFHLEASSRIVKTDVLCGFSLEVIPEEKYIPINDVHQLQNLYFALTNKELQYEN